MKSTVSTEMFLKHYDIPLAADVPFKEREPAEKRLVRLTANVQYSVAD